MRKQLLAAASGLAMLCLASPGHAGVGCLGPGPSAACASLLDYLMNDTGNGVGDLYTVLKNRVNTAGCPYGNSETGLYTFYGHQVDEPGTAIEAYAADNVTCAACMENAAYSKSLDGYAGACSPQRSAVWTFTSNLCSFEFNITLARAAFDVFWCVENRGAKLGITAGACSNQGVCLR